MRTIIATAALCVASFGVTVGGFMLGWGLRPKSWTWIVTFWVLSLVVIGAMGAVKREISKKPKS